MTTNRTRKAASKAKMPPKAKAGTGPAKPGPKKSRGVPRAKPVRKAMAIAGATKDLKVALSPDPLTAYAVDVDKAPLFFAIGKATRPIAPGDHRLSWAIEHTPGIVVTIKITTPPESVWEESREMPATGRWDGIHDFYVYA